MDIGPAENDEQRESTYRFLNEEISTQDRLLLEEGGAWSRLRGREQGRPVDLTVA